MNDFDSFYKNLFVFYTNKEGIKFTRGQFLKIYGTDGLRNLELYGDPDYVPPKQTPKNPKYYDKYGNKLKKR